MNIDKKYITGIILNIIIVVLTVIGTAVMVTNKQASSTGLNAVGFENLKFYTVLSNLFCGIVALIYLVIVALRRTESFDLTLPKLMAASAVGLTFLTIAAFLGPLYGHANLYKGSNLYFHLIVPVLAMVEFALAPLKRKTPFVYTWFAAIPTLIYGLCYLINILVNGVGEWPDTNDWYGFVNWGLPVGIVIFAVITLATFGTACLLRAVNNRVNHL